MPTDETLRHQGTLESVREMKTISATDRTGGFNYYHPRESDEDHRWRCLTRNMAYDDRLDKPAAQRLLDACRKLQSATTERADLLALEFNNRFGGRELEPQSSYGRPTRD